MIEKTWQCPSCGAQVDWSSPSCTACGSHGGKVIDKQQSEPSDDAYPPGPFGEAHDA